MLMVVIDQTKKLVIKVFLPDNSRKTVAGYYNTPCSVISDSVKKKVGTFADGWRLYDVKPFSINTNI